MGKEKEERVGVNRIEKETKKEVCGNNDEKENLQLDTRSSSLKVSAST